MRTTAMNVMQRGYVANIQRLNNQLRARMTLLVDATLCGGLACDANWLAHDLGVEVFGYTASNLTSQWPGVRWSDQLALHTLAKNTSWGLGWLVRRMDRTLFRAGHVSWPWSNEKERPLSIQAPALAEMLVPWLVHEPSVVFWWLHQCAHQCPIKVELRMSKYQADAQTVRTCGFWKMTKFSSEMHATSSTILRVWCAQIT